MEPNPSIEVQSASERDAIFERQLAYARRVSKDAVALLGVPEGPLAGDYPTGKRWNMSYQYLDGNLTLNIELQPQRSVAYVLAPISLVILSVVEDLERLLADPSAQKLFNITSDKELEDFLYDRTLGFSISYIQQLPSVLFLAFTQASVDAIIGHVKKMVEPWYKYEDDVDPKNLNLFPNTELGDILRRFPKVGLEFLRELDTDEKYFSHQRKEARSGRKVWLDREALEQLSDTFDGLRVEYTRIKKEYKRLHSAYMLINKKRNKRIDGWVDHWAEHLGVNYPDCYFTPNDTRRTPSELAYRHLSRIYDYSEKTIERKVAESRKAFRATKSRSAR